MVYTLPFPTTKHNNQATIKQRYVILEKFWNSKSWGKGGGEVMRIPNLGGREKANHLPRELRRKI